MKESVGALFIGVGLGVVGSLLAIKHKDKVKPMAAGLIAKGIQLKEKAINCAAIGKEHAEDIIAEAKHINKKPVKDTPVKAES